MNPSSSLRNRLSTSATKISSLQHDVKLCSQVTASKSILGSLNKCAYCRTKILILYEYHLSLDETASGQKPSILIRSFVSPLGVLGSFRRSKLPVKSF